MKKLLGILGAISLFTSTSGVVVACNKERIKTPKLNRELAKQLIAKLKGSDMASLDFGDMFSDEDITKVVVSIIDELIGQQYGYESTNYNLDKLGLKKYDYASGESKDSIPKSYIDSYLNNAGSIAEDLLFTEYTKSIASGKRLDNSLLKSLYNLNVIQETKIKEYKTDNEKTVPVGSYIEINDKRWQVFNEDGKGGSNNLPTLEQLTQEYANKKESPFFVVLNDGKSTKINISSKTALKLRFQDYFKNKLLSGIIENLLTMSFMEADMFTVSAAKEGSSPYINTGSPIFSKTQSWNSSTTTDWTTNVRMVWSLKFDNTENKNNNAIKKIVEGIKEINQANGELKSGESIKKLFSAFEDQKEKLPVYNGDNTNAYDSFFGLQGFKGFTLYENGTSLGTSPIAGAKYEDKVKEAKKPGILFDNLTPYFVDAKNSNIAEVVIVLPLYMIELLGGSKENDSSGKVYEIKDADGKGKAIEFGPSLINNSRYKDVWNQENNKKLHSKDVQDLNDQQSTILNQIKYLVSQDTGTADLAKTTLYSKYLNAKEIYFAGLYDQIGKYIRNDKDKDD